MMPGETLPLWTSRDGLEFSESVVSFPTCVCGSSLPGEIILHVALLVVNGEALPAHQPLLGALQLLARIELLEPLRRGQKKKKSERRANRTPCHLRTAVN